MTTLPNLRKCITQRIFLPYRGCYTFRDQAAFAGIDDVQEETPWSNAGMLVPVICQGIRPNSLNQFAIHASTHFVHAAKYHSRYPIVENHHAQNIRADLGRRSRSRGHKFRCPGHAIVAGHIGLSAKPRHTHRWTLSARPVLEQYISAVQIRASMTTPAARWRSPCGRAARVLTGQKVLLAIRNRTGSLRRLTNR